MEKIIKNRRFLNAASTETDKNDFQKAFNLCVTKTRGNIKQLADTPKSAASAVDGNYFDYKEGFYEIGNWTSSFFTGMALLAWHATEEEYFLGQVQRLAPFYREKASNPDYHSHHDMGFLFSLYSVALFKLSNDQENRKVALKAADALALRFNSQANFIRAWGKLGTDEHDNMAIIDCLMNLPLLYWASKESGNQQYFEIAQRHADTALKYFIRADYSVCHAFRFDIQSGRPIGEDNYCGYSKDSYWARGASWAIYGFALCYAYTKDKRYLDASLGLAKAFISKLDAKVVPPWDFRLPPNVIAIRDSSAAAVAVCGLQELERLQAADSKMIETKEILLNQLCQGVYLNFETQCRGVLKNGQFGNRPAVNGYTSWGDYFLMEALSWELFQIAPWW